MVQVDSPYVRYSDMPLYQSEAERIPCLVMLNEELRNKFTAKLAEYEGRLNEARTTSPESVDIASLRFKIRFVEMLLRNGAVDPMRVYLEFLIGEIDEEHRDGSGYRARQNVFVFEDIRVLAAYAADNASHIHDGRGRSTW